MFSRKILALGLAVTVCGAAAIFFYAGKLHPEASRQEAAKPVDTGFEPSIQDAPPMILMDEKSGQVWQLVTRDSKTQKIQSISIGFRDGRSGKYSFEAGKLKSFRGFAAGGKLNFEANYDSTSCLITDYKDLRADGSAKTLFCRKPDGSESLSFLDENGHCLKSVLTAPDGSQTVTERPDQSKEAKVSLVKAETSEQNRGQITLADGTKSWRFKFKLVGARVSAWEYRDAKGTLRQTGKFVENGNIEISFLDDQARPVLKQTWNCIGEDWSRRFYSLASMEKYSTWSGSLEGSILLYPDGVTPKETSSYVEGQKTSTEFYDEKGIKYHVEYYDTNGFSNGGLEVQQMFREKTVLPPQLVNEPTDDKDGAAIYRLKGSPYSSPVPEEGYAISPLFVLPR